MYDRSVAHNPGLRSSAEHAITGVRLSGQSNICADMARPAALIYRHSVRAFGARRSSVLVSVLAIIIGLVLGV